MYICVCWCARRQNRQLSMPRIKHREEIRKEVDGCWWLVLQPITGRMEIITIKVVCVRIVLKILFYQLPIMSEQVRLSCGSTTQPKLERQAATKTLNDEGKPKEDHSLNTKKKNRPSTINNFSSPTCNITPVIGTLNNRIIVCDVQIACRNYDPSPNGHHQGRRNHLTELFYQVYRGVLVIRHRPFAHQFRITKSMVCLDL